MDYTDIKLTSGTTAGSPFWAEFMKRASQIPAYANRQPPFIPPDGVVKVGTR